MKVSIAFALTAGMWLTAGIPARAEALDDVLARMDAAARQFQSYSATVKRVDYTKVLDAEDDSSGPVRLKRGKNGIIGIMDLTAGPDHYILHFNGQTVDRYFPKALANEQYNAKKFSTTLNQMLLLGFAVTREELKQNYDIRLVGTETVNGAPASHLLLTPKSAEALKYVKTIDLWIDAKGNAVQQKGTEPSGNYKLATFSDLKINPTLPDSAFELDLPKGVKTVKEN